MRTWLVLALVAAVTLAGCAEDSSSDEPTEPVDGDGAEAPDTNQTAEPSAGNMTGETSSENGTSDPVANTPPMAMLSATQAADDEPRVTFDINGSDDDGDLLTWTLDVDGDAVPDYNGTDIPAVVNHTYGGPGTFNVTLVVSDGTDDSPTSMDLEVTLQLPSLDVSGSFPLGLHGCVNNAYPGVNGLTFYKWVPNAETWGLPFEVSFSATGPVVEYNIHWWKGSSTVVGKSTSTEASFAGTVPATTNNAFFNTCGGGQVSVTYHAGG